MKKKKIGEKNKKTQRKMNNKRILNTRKRR
jgi:hypothetical protein